MKKYLITLVLTTLIAGLTTASAQSHRHTPRTQTEAATVNNDNTTTSKDNATTVKSDGKGSAKTGKQAKKTTTAAKATRNNTPTGSLTATAAQTSDSNDELEAYSDTTEVYDTDSATTQSYQFNIDEDGMDRMTRGFSWLADGLIGTLLILLIIFVFSPVAVIAVICYFIYKNRKQKMQLAEMAMKNGQKIPEDIVSRRHQTDDELWGKGIKNIFTGLGLVCLFAFMGFDTGKGIACLVICYGVGQAVIARTSARRHDKYDGREFPKDNDDISEA